VFPPEVIRRFDSSSGTTEFEPEIVQPVMKLKHAINSRTLLVPSLALNVALLVLGADFVTQIKELYEQVTQAPAGQRVLKDVRERPRAEANVGQSKTRAVDLAGAQGPR
jgi:hypothetical protein